MPSMRASGKVHLGLIEHINKEEKPLKCTCEFGFRTPTPLETVASGGACTHESRLAERVRTRLTTLEKALSLIF